MTFSLIYALFWLRLVFSFALFILSLVCSVYVLVQMIFDCCLPREIIFIFYYHSKRVRLVFAVHKILFLSISSPLNTFLCSIPRLLLLPLLLLLLLYIWRKMLAFHIIDYFAVRRSLLCCRRDRRIAGLIINIIVLYDDWVPIAYVPLSNSFQWWNERILSALQ